jgi:RHS repeat-associated protein
LEAFFPKRDIANTFFMVRRQMLEAALCGDLETGLDLFAARYYGSALGRFTSPGPMNLGADLLDPQSWNAYAYVRNNPLALVDPMGLCHMGANNIAYDDEPGDCGGGSVTVTAQAPEEITLFWVSFPSGGAADQNPLPTPPPQLSPNPCWERCSPQRT